MTEREFLVKFIDFLYNGTWQPEWLIDKFLEKHYKDYFEVKFYHKKEIWNILEDKSKPNSALIELTDGTVIRMSTKEANKLRYGQIYKEPEDEMGKSD